jgi:hypothetical protein
MSPKSETMRRAPPRDHTRGKSKLPANRLLTVRLHELTNLLRHRHGRGLDTDDADIILVPIARILFRRFANSGRVASDENLTAELMAYCKQHTPLIPRQMVVSMAVEAMARPELENKFTLGLRVMLTNKEHDQLHIGTFRPFDLTPHQFEQARKQKRRDQDRARKTAKRLQMGMRPWAQSLSRIKPWKQEGISRAKYYRRMKRERETGETKVSATNLTSGRGNICLTSAKRTSDKGTFHRRHRAAQRRVNGQVRGRIIIATRASSACVAIMGKDKVV